ncbi:MAG: cyclopropane-fatty-acyl-phospholipid synthase family protein [Burkholderiales bacterium]|nr:cyclopropane-fatty-acyl-phospholipid synthase family protein [Burkholderiales bacterium]
MTTTELAARGHDATPPFAARLLFRMFDHLRSGSLDVMSPDGRYHAFPGQLPGTHASLELRDWAVCADILRRGDIGFAEAYFNGRWDSEDLTALLTLAADNQPVIERALHGSWWAMLAYRIRHLLRANTRSGSRRNIHAHYDLGNDFYRLWLDGSMTYSAALFEGTPGRSLEAGQTAKYQRILDRLQMQPGDHVLEIGCGWGGFAEHAAATRGCRVTGVTVSQAQLDFARARIAARGLQHLVELKLCDYRDLDGQFDHVVSIEMFEAVGERYWPRFFRALRDRLAPGGRALVQTITIADAKFERYRSGTDFIQQYIFPGGMLPSPARFEQVAADAGLATGERLMFGIDYAHTLSRWHRNFLRAAADIEALGFDARFMRLWRFYLSYCEAGFRSGSTDVMQVELARS